jgi:hypothetical protein
MPRLVLSYYNIVNVLTSNYLQPTIVKLYEQAHLAMDQYRKGKWPPTLSDDKVDAGVMKLIGRADFAPVKPQEATTPTESDYGENLQPNGVHPVLFEYMKHFENQSERTDNATLYPPLISTVNFIPEERMFPSVSPEFATTNGISVPHLPGESVKNANNINPLYHHSGLSNFTNQSFRSTDWPSNGLYGNPSALTNSIHGYPPHSTSQPFLYEDPLLDHGVGPLQDGHQQPQDQVWEQFLSTLMPTEAPQDSASM